GQIVLNPGKRLMPADIGLLASLGIPEVKVKRRVRAAFFSTGDELRSVGESLGPGQIYDSNRYTLYGMLTRLGIDFLDLGIIPDQREATEQALQTAASEADLVLTSGGVSVGDADYVTETLQQQGQVNFWKILMKPGHPLTFGKIGSTVFFGLPGNPVSAMVTFYQFVQPALRRMQGETETTPLRLKAPTVSKLKRKPGRTEFQRGILETDASGQLQVRSTGPQGSGVLSSMSKANCFIVLPKEQGSVEPGSIVEVEPFAGLI
ncbi:MAG: molybdopterin molybdenumtransferase MoeA, partial [Gammaproteobacteria bacterium]|nr:molybdopterin molybdenumtransferase MoeA [Gammaproteobacteria bacterium]